MVGRERPPAALLIAFVSANSLHFEELRVYGQPGKAKPQPSTTRNKSVRSVLVLSNTGHH